MMTDYEKVRALEEENARLKTALVDMTRSHEIVDRENDRLKGFVVKLRESLNALCGRKLADIEKIESGYSGIAVDVQQAERVLTETTQ